jgi:hypothetical protein
MDGPKLWCLSYVSIRQHTSAYVSIRQHTSAYVSTSVEARVSGARHDRYGWPEIVVLVVCFERANRRALSEVTEEP